MRHEYELIISLRDALPYAWVESIAKTARTPTVWLPIYLAMLFWLVLDKRWKGLAIFVAIIIGFGFADFISANLWKPLFDRPRPCNNPEVLRYLQALVPCGSGKSMPSNHAANHTVVSAIAIMLGKPRKIGITLLIGWPLLVMFSQVYVGVHYPTDVLAGAAWGLIVAFTVVIVCKRVPIYGFNRNN